MKRAENGPLDPELSDAFRALTNEQRTIAAPKEIEDRVMAAWDDAHRLPSRSVRSFLGRDLLATAAAGLLAAAIGYWWASDTRRPSATPALRPPVTTPSWPSEETLAWLGADLSSLQLVRIRVASTALAEHGYALNDPDGDGLIDVEMIIGTDGMAQTVRLSPAIASE